MRASRVLNTQPGGLAQLGERLAGSQKVIGSSPLSSTQANLREIASWPFSLALATKLDFRGFVASGVVPIEVQLDGFLGPIRRKWIELRRSPSAGSTGKSLGGTPVGNQVETTKPGESDSSSRASVGDFLAGLLLRSLRPESHEFGSYGPTTSSFIVSQVFVHPELLSSIPEQHAEYEARRIIQAQSVASASEHLANETPLVNRWSAFWSNSRNGGVTLACREAEWSPLALWIAEQLKQGVQHVPLPPLPELRESIYQKDRVDYRFRRFAERFRGPPETHPLEIDALPWQDAFQLLNRLTEVYPSLLFATPFGTFPRECSPLTLRVGINRFKTPEMPTGIAG